jgi:hypothetical protein
MMFLLFKILSLVFFLCRHEARVQVWTTGMISHGPA